MKPVTAELVAAALDIANARTVLAVNSPEQAARLAYYAMFHAAQALIFDRSDRLPKTHRGTRTQFHRLARGEPGIDADLPAILTSSYELKEAADYETGTAAIITPVEAGEAIDDAARFVSQVTQFLAGPTP